MNWSSWWSSIFPASAIAQASLDWPATAETPEGELAQGRAVFDPAMSHFVKGYRASEPVFSDAVQASDFRKARLGLLTEMLALLGGSRFRDQLVLRGSAAMPMWVGFHARDPHDLDFVVVPADVSIDGDVGKELFIGLAALVAEATFTHAKMIAARPTVSDIWTYDRVPGRRLVFHWQVGDLPWGALQLDFVFNEPLPMPPRRIEQLGLLTAAPELSLAWKLLWLHTDAHLCAKDLYDAVVLAENYSVGRSIVEDVFALAGEPMPTTFSGIMTSHLEWVGVDCPPDAESVGTEWRRRLFVALPWLASHSS